MLHHQRIVKGETLNNRAADSAVCNGSSVAILSVRIAYALSVSACYRSLTRTTMNDFVVFEKGSEMEAADLEPTSENIREGPEKYSRDTQISPNHPGGKLWISTK
jgi:hypothetical protein